MSDIPWTTPSQTPDDREARIQQLLGLLQPNADSILRRMAERLVHAERQLEGGALHVIEQDVQVVGVDEGVLG